MSDGRSGGDERIQPPLQTHHTHGLPQVRGEVPHGGRELSAQLLQVGYVFIFIF